MSSSSAPSTSSSSTLEARELPSMVNSPELLEGHRKINGDMVRTRFPPEPNGFLHIGHCKSMNMNFFLAFEKLGVPKENRQTYFRYDDTNPEAESKEYVDSIAEDVEWCGWRPVKTTFSSDYFHELHALAIELIKRDKAYVCHQTKAEVEACREIAKVNVANPDGEKAGDPCSPWRNRPIEESLKEFENMRKGKYEPGKAVLRMKIDMNHVNPNMWDPIAYRVLYTPHPHVGDEWCIYPTYDYTHCIIDSLEHIDYSICTLEFEGRRESYFWLLEALDLYRPKVYEMSRLNVAYTQLSKRKLLKLVKNGYMDGWDDPRMPTIKGLRRRGYTAEILNAFCNEIGATRNANTVEYEKLAFIARSALHESSPRVMAVLDPVLVTISNLSVLVDSSVAAAPKLSSSAVEGAPELECTVPNFPHDTSRGSHSLLMTDKVYINRSDCSAEPKEDFFGMMVGQVVGLKYAGKVRVDAVKQDADGKVTRVVVTAISPAEPTRPKSTIQWVPFENSIPSTVVDYGHLFKSEEPPDADWEADLNPNSKTVYAEAMVDPSIFCHGPKPEGHFQFERLGFYVIDRHTPEGACSQAGAASGERMTFNLTVSLKDSKPKAEGAPNRSRKEEQALQLAEKMAKMSLIPSEMFKPPNCHLYGSWDEEGIPLTTVEGEKLSKSNSKKLKKDMEKQKRLYASSKK